MPLCQLAYSLCTPEYKHRVCDNVCCALLQQGGVLRRPKAASRQLVACLPKALALSQIPSDDLLPQTVDVVVTDTQTGALALPLHRPTVGGRVSAAREDHRRATVAHRQRHVQVPA